MVSLWNARSYLKELKTNLNSSQRAPAFLLPRLTPLHYKFFAQSPPSARASAPSSYATHAAQGLQDSGHHSSHWPDSPAQRPDGATTLKWRLTTNRGWRPNVHLCSFADSRLKKKRKSHSLITKSMEDFVQSKNVHSENMQEYVHLRLIRVVLRQKPIQPCKAMTQLKTS